METTVIKAEPRDRLGTNYTRRVRAQDKLPAIIYGHGETPETVSIPAHDVMMEMGKGARVLHLDLGGQEKVCLIKSVQYDHWGSHPIHLDLMRVSKGERVRVSVALELRGSPAGLKEGGVLENPVSQLEVECDVDSIPESLQVGIGAMKIGDVLVARDVALPGGVTLLSDPDLRVAAVRLITEEAAAPAAEEGAVAEPEVISRGKKDEEGEAEA